LIHYPSTQELQHQQTLFSVDGKAFQATATQ